MGKYIMNSNRSDCKNMTIMIINTLIAPNKSQ